MSQSQDELQSKLGVDTPINDSLFEAKEESPLAVLPEKHFKDYISISVFCLFVAFGGFVFGFDTGTISGFVNMSDFTTRFGQLNADGTYYLSDVRTGLLVSIFNVGCAVGGIFLCKIADVYGRRMGLMFSMVIYVVGIIIQISSTTKWYQYFIGRLIAGLAVGTVSVVSPLFISEVAPKQLRGTLVCCFQLCITLGIFLGYCTTYGTKSYSDSRQWRIPLGLCFAWALFLVAGMLNMPESPRYLVEKSRIEEARKSIARSNKVNEEDPAVYTEVQLIQAGIDREALAGKASWGELITGKPKILRRVIMGIMLQSLQQLTGDNYFFYYGTTIFQAVGLQDSFQTSIILGIVNFASTFVGIYAIERMGRRLCLLTGSACMFVCFIIYSLIGTQHLYKDGFSNDPSNTYKPSGDAMIFITCLYIFFFASTWAGGVYCIISESYPLRIRSKAMSVATAANWMWGFLISFFTPFITSAIHFYYGFVFTGCLLFSFFYVYFFVVETKGLSLEEVDILYASGTLPWKSSGWVPPSVEDMAKNTFESKPTDEHV
ncbi:general substrate transporter [Metschnikowia bicuspidata var. bicuspidata NRRL YB-4993]|uniref:General substrate transporter n=1 Tax=Metschnikowia bicuspidata var. bicuspidata NRRL YB-4993 TaxID=869754 RepID=A0A1A0HK54_9ASCO|nr:general substrate transporter [Metschnikowia bicuspidata var. bicuspidata NRRL YB-4993]OBA24405.1 general substrate transporter [Metschnikowia bicuspidata var. bicuspidata NRRL YB-4993]